MAGELSPRFALPFLAPAQAQKEVFHNEALSLLDQLVHMAVESADIFTPPANPMEEKSWLVADGAVGEWAGQSGKVAAWTGGGWRFIPPVIGMRVWVANDGEHQLYTGAGWQKDAVRNDGYYVAGIKVVGTRQNAVPVPTGGSVVDTQCRIAVEAILDALRAHGLLA
jgi:Protein of unknown function (DUF2793)